MKITPEMTLAAAKAIHQRFANRSGHGRQWEVLPAITRKQYLDEALAALEAALTAS